MVSRFEVWWVTRRVESAIKAIAGEVTREEHWVTHYGANDIHWRHLVFWICVQTDAERDRLRSQPELTERLRRTLHDARYPEEGIDGVFIGFESKETVDREAGGNWFLYWK